MSGAISNESLCDDDYRQLLLLRTELRRFLHQSETWARGAGLTGAQHQLLLAIRGHDAREGPTISDVAGYLLLRHHSTVELVNRAVSAGFVTRHPDPDDARAVRLSLTKTGAQALARLTARNREELARLADRFRPLWHDLGSEQVDAVSLESGRQAPKRISVGRVYDDTNASAYRLLVDRLWPRGLRKADARFEWRKQLAPSTELRRWYGHDLKRFEEFAKRYTEELDTEHASEIAELAALSAVKSIVLLTATKDVERSGAAVLAKALRTRTTSPSRKRR